MLTYRLQIIDIDGRLQIDLDYRLQIIDYRQIREYNLQIIDYEIRQTSDITTRNSHKDHTCNVSTRCRFKLQLHSLTGKGYISALAKI